jgi:glycosyltransferase involved in cell wall biosynthesis
MAPVALDISAEGSALPPAEPLRVLINALHAKTGGGVTYLRGLLPHLATDPRFELHVFLHRSQFSLFADIDERVRVHLFDLPDGLFRLLIWEQITLPILARLMAADIVFSPANYGPLLVSGAVIMLRNSLAVAEREGRPLKRIYWGLLALATALSIVFSRKTIAVSKYAAQALTRGIPRRMHDKVAIIHHGVNPIFRASNEPRNSFLLIVADIYVQKNLHTVIDAMDRLRSRIPGVRLKIAGRIVDRGYFDELQVRIKRHQLSDVITFLGTVEPRELVRLYQACQLLIFPSTVETFGHPLVEAMACGTPIASSKSAAMPEVLGDAGLYFDPLDAEDMANTIYRVSMDTKLRAELSKKGLQRACEYSLVGTAGKTASLLISAAPAHRRRPL